MLPCALYWTFHVKKAQSAEFFFVAGAVLGEVGG